jgi:peptidyl-prolyl cis-trans isomerase B (cyclophilin B)
VISSLKSAPRGPVVILVAAVLLLALAGCGQIPQAPGQESSGPTASVPATAADCEYTETGEASRPVQLPPTTDVEMSGAATAVITMSAGELTVTLDRDRAPCTVNSFVSLAQQKFFDETVCPRMTIGGLSMLQCGDPTGTRTGGPGYSFPDELSGDETYPAGTVAMANSGPNTNGSQFVLVYADSQLEPTFTVFGTVDEAGLTVLNGIAAGGVDNSNAEGDGAPLKEAKIISVTVQ